MSPYYGEEVAPVHFAGVYLPLLWKRETRPKPPLRSFFFPLLRASVSEHADGERRPIPFSERPWPGPFASSFGPFFPGESPPSYRSSRGTHSD